MCRKIRKLHGSTGDISDKRGRYVSMSSVDQSQRNGAELAQAQPHRRCGRRMALTYRAEGEPARFCADVHPASWILTARTRLGNGYEGLCRCGYFDLKTTENLTAQLRAPPQLSEEALGREGRANDVTEAQDNTQAEITSLEVVVAQFVGNGAKKLSQGSCTGDCTIPHITGVKIMINHGNGQWPPY
ncbi:hypothetical protein Bbelb_346340 [Branchiostoma belcheri]|nr:hypothetical protein Bbelb_346340 [Branchiostoma belcheri]